jgi:hypothetical protein
MLLHMACMWCDALCSLLAASRVAMLICMHAWLCASTWCLLHQDLTPNTHTQQPACVQACACMYCVRAVHVHVWGPAHCGSLAGGSWLCNGMHPNAPCMRVLRPGKALQHHCVSR